ncbi:MAG: sulfite exporter TauE/SafE family protein [Bacteroidota bacterium]
MQTLVIVLIGVVAVLYASVGHGGASGYLAIMALFNLDPAMARPTALLLNLFVAGFAFYAFFKKGYFKISFALPFLYGSVPAAFIGGLIQLESGIYRILLGSFLLVATLRMIFNPVRSEKEVLVPIFLRVTIGAAIGLMSGMLGIGGGIILSPVILLLGLSGLKQTAATSAVFIWVNSAAAFFGFSISGISLSADSLLAVLAASLGGAIGGYLGSFKFDTVILRRLLALVLMLASFKLIFI